MANNEDSKPAADKPAATDSAKTAEVALAVTTVVALVDVSVKLLLLTPKVTS